MGAGDGTEPFQNVITFDVYINEEVDSYFDVVFVFIPLFNLLFFINAVFV